MYFTSGWVSKISKNLFRSLSEDGWFVVSSSELSSQVFPQFTPVNFPGAILYRKTKKEGVQTFPVHSLLSETLVEKDIHPFTLSPPLPITPSPPLPFTHSSTQEPQAIPEKTSADRISAIRLLANQGHLSEALSLCNKAIASEKLIPGYYFIRASILQELDKKSEAIISLKQAIYIDPEYIMGHFTLGNLFFRQGNSKNAKRYFKNVLDLLNDRANDDILPESEGLSVKFIREIILSDMQTQLTK